MTDPAPKKVSLFEYRKNREATSSSSSLASPQSASCPISSESSINVEEHVKEQPPSVASPSQEPQNASRELDSKLGQMLDKNMTLIPEKIFTLPGLMRNASEPKAKINILNFILKLRVIESVAGFGENALLREVIYNWLKICLIAFEQQHELNDVDDSLETKQIVMLLFEMLARLKLNHEFLKSSKYLKVMNKLCEVHDDEVAQKANEFFHSWNRILATSSATTAKTQKPPIPSVNANEIFPVNAANSINSSKGGRLLSSNLHHQRPQPLASEAILSTAAAANKATIASSNGSLTSKSGEANASLMKAQERGKNSWNAADDSKREKRSSMHLAPNEEEYLREKKSISEQRNSISDHRNERNGIHDQRYERNNIHDQCNEKNSYSSNDLQNDEANFRDSALTSAEEHSKSQSARIAPRSKRVSFAPDELLVQIRYFELEDSEESFQSSSAFPKPLQRGRASYHEAEREEASFALKRLAQVDCSQIPWRNPSQAFSPIDIPNCCKVNWGVKSQEAKMQQERERRVLSVTYYYCGNQTAVPPSPAEPEEDQIVPLDASVPKIPLYDVVAQGQNCSSSSNSSASVSSTKIDYDALMALVHNPELMRKLQSI